MQRNMELIRAILKDVQARDSLEYSVVAIEGHPIWQVQRHVELLVEAGFLQGASNGDNDEGYPDVVVRDLTFEGHDFLAALADDKVWAKLKQTYSATQLVGMPLAIIKKLGMTALQAYALQQLGLPGA
jgi:Hypothetical protein (DUF2513)